tara:strand:+ start:18214 stop:19644 length:1431 start_codon:yes stop_codon:yes gene_type:complete
MSYNLNDYFQLGLDSESMPQNSLVMNTIRTPVNTQSGRDGLSKITFKIPKIGMLTGDSMITVQFIENGTPAFNSGDVTPNFISGALGCIERARLLVDNKVLTDLERPSMLEIPKMYSEKTENEVSQFSNKFLATQFQTNVNEETGNERFNIKKTRYLSAADQTTDTQNTVRNRITSQANSKVYGIHLKHLGAEFLENQSLPVFLLGDREMVLELFFYKDCREYIVSGTSTAGQLVASSVVVNYPLCELVTTHIQLPDDTQANEIANLQSNPVAYPLHDNYVVKSNFTTLALNVAQAQKTFRINAQNRELHKLLMVHNPDLSTYDGTNRVVANQRAITLGNITFQMKSNGLNLYERPITNPSILYQQTTYAHNGMALKLPYNSFHVNNRVNAIPQNTQTCYLSYRGTQHYLAIDFKNGNGGVFGGGTVQKQAMEIDYEAITRVAANPTQPSTQFDVLFYLTVSKMLTIGSRTVEISF